MGAGDILIIVLIFFITLVTPTVVVAAKVLGKGARPSQRRDSGDGADERDDER
ncbi:MULTISPECIES: hypothetical protein [Corynebacterium]|uniref:hypothetical protein n=1 Tax=Corynebacterium TaxID=1716 RepID=UPI00178C2EA5|nr:MULTISPECIES: hypothetical protein [Corynebacterium]